MVESLQQGVENIQLTEVQKAAQDYINSSPSTKGRVYAKGFTDDKGDTFYTVQYGSGDETAFSIAKILAKLNGIEASPMLAKIRFTQNDDTIKKGETLRLKGSYYQNKPDEMIWELQIQKD